MKYHDQIKEEEFEIASITMATTKKQKGASWKGSVSSARFNACRLCEPSYLSGTELPSS